MLDSLLITLASLRRTMSWKPQTSAGPSPGASIDTDAALELIARSQRRRLLAHLDDVAGPVDLDDLAVELGGQHDGSLERTRVSLHHVHLPKLADAGVVEYSREHGNVELTPVGEQLTALLERFATVE